MHAPTVTAASVVRISRGSFAPAKFEAVRARLDAAEEFTREGVVFERLAVNHETLWEVRW